MISFSDIENAYMFVSSAPYGMNSAVLCKKTGQIFFQSDMSDIDETEEEDLDWNNCIEIPHKNDLNLGEQLVFAFVDKHIPDEYNSVYRIFRRRGAYGRFKNHLDSIGMLDTWYDFEDKHEKQALRKWCQENEIALLA